MQWEIVIFNFTKHTAFILEPFTSMKAPANQLVSTMGEDRTNGSPQ